MCERYTPLTIELMLHCYYSGDPSYHASWMSPAGKEWRAWAQVNDLITHEGKVTAFGRAWVGMILDTPLPVKAFIDPRNGLKIGEDNA
jgi:hypothetical protein